jgi:hypothetical protein
MHSLSPSLLVVGGMFCKANICSCPQIVRLIGKLEDGTVFVRKGHDGEEPFEFKTDEEQVIEGLDITVVNMKKGEVALVRVPPEHAFGSVETKQDLAIVPPNSTVFYEVELVSFEKVRLKLLLLICSSWLLLLTTL